MKDHTPLYPYPLIGWKILRFYRDNSSSSVYLSSPIYDETWYEEEDNISLEHRAHCRSGLRRYFGYQHEAPAEGCTCGFWAYNTFDDGVSDLTSTFFYFRVVYGLPDIRNYKYDDLICLVWGYGNWFLNDCSWRSEYMKVAAICDTSLAKQELVSGAAEKLDVPVMSLEEMKEFAESVGKVML